MAAFKKAVANGAKAIELDIQVSRDGVMCVMHDDRLERTTKGSGKLVEQSWEQLRALDAGSWYAADFAEEKLPRLDEVLDWAKESHIHVFIEVKKGPRPQGFAGQLVDLIRSKGLESEVSVISFDHQVVREVEKQAPEVRTGALYSARNAVALCKRGALGGALSGALLGLMAGPVGALAGALGGALAGALGGRLLSTLQLRKVLEKNAELDMVCPHWFNLDPVLMSKAAQQGQEVIPYTLNHDWQVKAARGLGVDGIITDHPERYLT
jgi:glycerophosphoryl diester phosphodiesterase